MPVTCTLFERKPYLRLNSRARPTARWLRRVGVVLRLKNLQPGIAMATMAGPNAKTAHSALKKDFSKLFFFISFFLFHLFNLHLESSA